MGVPHTDDTDEQELMPLTAMDHAAIWIIGLGGLAVWCLLVWAIVAWSREVARGVAG